MLEVRSKIPPQDGYKWDIKEQTNKYTIYTREEAPKELAEQAQSLLRIQSEQRYSWCKARMAKITEHKAQAIMGIKVPNLEQEETEFFELLNEVRIYENKKPKEKNY